MCFLDTVTIWYDGVKMVDFGYPRQGLEREPLRRDGLAREGKLLIFGGLAGALGCHIGYIG